MMRNFYTFLSTFLIAGSIFAQGVATSNIKPAPKKISDSKIPRVQNTQVFELRSSVDCASSSALYCEDFEGVTAPELPTNLTTSTLEDGYSVPIGAEETQITVSGFYTGDSDDANAGGFFPVGAHGQFAMTNDDACRPSGVIPNEQNNCDLSFETLVLPTLDMTEQAGNWLLFEFYHDKNYGGGDAFVQISIDDGASWEELSGPLDIADTWQTGAYDLSTYEGNSAVLIRFTWTDDSSWATGLAIDDIVIEPLPDYQITMIQSFHGFGSYYFGVTSYNNAPMTQAAAAGYNFGGELRNLGLNNLDSARLHSTIEGVESNSDGVSLLPLSKDTFFCNDIFVPTMAGTYTAEISGKCTEQGVQTPIESVAFSVNNDLDYGRDDYDLNEGWTGGSYVNDAGDEQRGNVFDIYADAEVYAIKAIIHPATTANTVAKAILSRIDTALEGQAAFQFIYETPSVAVGQNVDQWINFVFDVPQLLLAGEMYVATVFSSFTGSDTLAIATSGLSDGGESVFQDIDGTINQEGSEAGDWYGTLATPMVRLNFDPNATAPVGIKENNGKAFNVFPNPNNGEFNLSITNTESNNIVVAMQNIIGQNVYSEKFNNITNLNKNFNFSQFEKGVYTISVSYDNGEKLTQKVIIK
jgi:hypothetical protein